MNQPIHAIASCNIVAVAERDDICIDHRSFMGSRYFRWQIQNQQLLLRLLLYPVLLSIRLWQVLFLAPQYDSVWISREMAPLGPPVLEQLLVWRCKRVILDVDDALHIPDKESASLIPRLLRDRGKFGRMASPYTSVVCGNAYLADFYNQHQAKVEIIPTVVDAKRYEDFSLSAGKRFASAGLGRRSISITWNRCIQFFRLWRGTPIRTGNCGAK